MLFSESNFRRPHTEDELKQVYIYNQMPQKGDFEIERQFVFDTILHQITGVNPNVLLVCGGDYIFFLQRYKHLYGLRSEEVRVLINLFTNLLFGKIQISIQIKTYLVKVLVFLFQLEIQIDNLNIDNITILDQFKELARTNHLHQTKSFETYIGQFSYLTYLMSQHGQDIMKEVFQFAVEKREIRYIALFIQCVSERSNAEMLLRELFEVNGFWDQDLNWLFILQTIIKKFPDLDYARRFQPIFLNIIKFVNDTLNGPEGELSGLYEEELLGLPTASRSISKIIVGLIVPSTKPHYNQIWMYIQRLMNLSLSQLSPTHQHLGSVCMIPFIKNFIKLFIKRENNEKEQWQYMINDDAINNLAQRVEVPAPKSDNHLDKNCLQKFDKIARMVIQKYMYIQSSVKDIEAIMNSLATFDPTYHTLILNQIQYILNRDQEFIITTAVSILNNLLQYSIVVNPDRTDDIIDIVRRLLQIIDKKGLNDNMYLLEVILKMFIYFPKDKVSLDSVKEELLDIIITNIDTISTVYSTQKEEQSELYIDMNNLFNPLFFSLDETQFKKFRERLVYYTLAGVKKHSDGYERLLMIYSYMDPTFPDEIVDKVFKQILKEQKSPSYYFLEETPYSLQIENKESVEWYVGILECSLQYNPKAIVKHWNKLDQLISSLLKNSKKEVFECGYGMMFNIVVSLSQSQLPVKDFQDLKNYNYKTLKLNWKKPSSDAVDLIKKIVDKYVYNAINFIKDRYKDKWSHRYTHSQLIDGILLQLSSSEHVTEERKFLQKTISIIESVVESILPNLRMKQDPEADRIQSFRETDYFEDLNQLTDDVIHFLQDLMHLSNTFGFLSDPDYTKVFYNFYADMHGNLYVADMLVSAESVLKKLKPWSKTRSSNVVPSQYLLVGEVLFCYYLRIDFLSSILPFNKLYPECLWNFMVLDHHQAIKVQEKIIDPYFPEKFHNRHKRILQIWLQKLDKSNPESYIAKALDPNTTKNQKQRYQKAIFQLILMLKKLSQYLNLSCCVQDPDIHRLIFEITKTYQSLQKKKDRITMLNHIFSIYTVQFQLNFIMKEQNQQETLLKVLESPTKVSKIQSALYNGIIEKCRHQTTIVINEPQLIKLSNTRMKQQIKRIIEESIVLLSDKVERQEKYLCLISLFMIIYSRFLSEDDELLSKIFLVVENTSKSPVPEIHRIGRVGVFHLINRIQRFNFQIYRVDNVMVQTDFEGFLVERNYNQPQTKPAGTTFCHKYKYMFFNYPYIEGGEERHLTGKETLFPIEKTILEFVQDEQRIAEWYESCLTDQQFTKGQESDQLIDNSQTILNYLLDKDPLKVNIFGDLTETFEMYALNFYYRLTKKICQLVGPLGVQSCQKLASYFMNKKEDEHQMMYCNIATGILKRSSPEFISIYLQSITSCNNEIFLYHLSGLYQMFKENPFTIKQIYRKIIERLREEKGLGRLRHIEIWKMFVLNQGRWAREEAIDGFKHLLKGIEESSLETAEAIVSCIVECFTVNINLELLPLKIPDSVSTLVKEKKIFKTSERVGFEINPILQQMIQLINSKIEEQKQLSSQGLKIYTKISTKIFDSLFVYQFNDYFYGMLQTIIKHLVEKPIEDVSQIEIIKRLGDGEYPNNIYKKIKGFLEDLANKAPIIVKKKLKLLEMIMFNRGYSTNDIQIPGIFGDIGNITIYHIITASNVFKAMTPQELENTANAQIASTGEQRYPILMALIMASGNQLYQWKQNALKLIVGWKMKKLVKEFVSTWWKGKGEGCEGEESLAILVRNVGNPYNYLA